MMRIEKKGGQNYRFYRQIHVFKEQTMRGLKNKRVLITGGARGIGAATADRFLEEGASVIVLDRDEVGCQRLKDKMPALKGTIVADVSDAEAVAHAFHELDELLKGLDILINNAGISVRKPFLDISIIRGMIISYQNNFNLSFFQFNLWSFYCPLWRRFPSIFFTFPVFYPVVKFRIPEMFSNWYLKRIIYAIKS